MTKDEGKQVPRRLDCVYAEGEIMTEIEEIKSDLRSFIAGLEELLVEVNDASVELQPLKEKVTFAIQSFKSLSEKIEELGL